MANASRAEQSVRAFAAELEAAGARLAIELPSGERVRVGGARPAALVRVKTPSALAALARRDHLRIGEAHLAGEIDVDGDLLEVMKATDGIALAQGPLTRVGFGLRLLLSRRVDYDRASIAEHYDRPAEFFLPWLGRWRCYSHGLYDSPDDSLDAAIERKLGRAYDALGLEPGMDVLDMGGGWGCFVEFAGSRGVRVHAITISEVQHRYVARLIAERELPCSVELVNFREYRPRTIFDAAVFMGTFEHNPEYPRAARFLQRHLAPGARVWADFCAQRTDFAFGRFMKRYVWPGPIRYVSPHALCEALIREGFNVHELVDDTLSYAYTTRDWGDLFEEHRKSLAERFGESTVRAFLIFLRGSEHFLRNNRTQAYHLVAGLGPAPVGTLRPDAASDS